MNKETTKQFFEQLTKEEIELANSKGQEEVEKDYAKFVEFYSRWECYLCWKSFKTFSSEKPCLHYLLHQNSNFKKKHFPAIYESWGYFNIASYLRWVANQEVFAKNVNDLFLEKSISKKFEYTVTWRHITWTFSCDQSDFEWHIWKQSNFPHYHFQMRISKQPFINFREYHIPFSEEDLFNFEAMDCPNVIHSWWKWMGMQELMDTMELAWEDGLNYLKSTENEEKAQIHVQTLITWPITWKDLQELYLERDRTWKTLAAIAKQEFWAQATVIQSPMEDIPDIEKRQAKRKRK